MGSEAEALRPSSRARQAKGGIGAKADGDEVGGRAWEKEKKEEEANESEEEDEEEDGDEEVEGVDRDVDALAQPRVYGVAYRQ